MKLLLDMNLTPHWVDFLEAAKFPALHGSQIASDTEIMEYAGARGFIVLTHDLDFSAILAATQGEKPKRYPNSRKEYHPAAVGKVIISTLHHSRVDLEAGALVTVEADRGLDSFHSG